MLFKNNIISSLVLESRQEKDQEKSFGSKEKLDATSSLATSKDLNGNILNHGKN